MAMAARRRTIAKANGAWRGANTQIPSSGGDLCETRRGLRAWASPKNGTVGRDRRARGIPPGATPEADPGLAKGEEGTPNMDVKGRPACGVPAVLSPRPHRTGRFQPPRPPLFGDPLRGRPLSERPSGCLLSALWARPARSGREAAVFGRSTSGLSARANRHAVAAAARARTPPSARRGTASPPPAGSGDARRLPLDGNRCQGLFSRI